MQETESTQQGQALRFQSLFDPGRALQFPCNEAGDVDMNALSDRALQNYLFARTVIGREFLSPTVVPTGVH